MIGNLELSDNVELPSKNLDVLFTIENVKLFDLEEP